MLYSASVEELAKPVKKEKPQGVEKKQRKLAVVGDVEKKPRKPRTKKIPQEPTPSPTPDPVTEPVVEPTAEEVKEEADFEKLYQEKQQEIEEVSKKIAALEGKPKDDDPPEWFKKYIKNMKNDENSYKKEKKSKKSVDAEANVEAKKHWNDEHTRNVVNHAADRHLAQMQKLYYQMFRR